MWTSNVGNGTSYDVTKLKLFQRNAIFDELKG